MPVEDFIIYVSCCVEDIYPKLVINPIRTRGFQPPKCRLGESVLPATPFCLPDIDPVGRLITGT